MMKEGSVRGSVDGSAQGSADGSADGSARGSADGSSYHNDEDSSFGDYEMSSVSSNESGGGGRKQALDPDFEEDYNRHYSGPKQTKRRYSVDKIAKSIRRLSEHSNDSNDYEDLEEQPLDDDNGSDGDDDKSIDKFDNRKRKAKAKQWTYILYGSLTFLIALFSFAAMTYFALSESSYYAGAGATGRKNPEMPLNLPTVDLGEIPKILFGSFTSNNVAMDFNRDVPVGWDIPWSGNVAIKNIFGQCLGLVQSRDSENHYQNEQQLEVKKINGELIVNVDTYLPEGIDRAKQLGLVESEMAQVIHSPHLFSIATLFAKPVQKQGRVFAMFRHPIDRARSSFLHLQQEHAEARTPSSLPRTIEEYSRSPFVENNFVTRSLLNKPLGVLTERDALIAMKIIREKCLVGLFEEMDTSILRFEQYFGWSYDLSDPNMASCHTEVMETVKEDHYAPPFDPDSTTYSRLKKENEFDLFLYAYAVKVFNFQGKVFFVDT